MINDRKVCSHCGAKTVEYRHSLNRGLVTALWKFHRACGRMRKPRLLSHVVLTNNEFTNFQKLKYWNLVEDINGRYQVTHLGAGFLEHGVSISRVAISYRGKCIGYDGRVVSFLERLPDNYDQAHDYARNAIAHTNEETTA